MAPIITQPTEATATWLADALGRPVTAVTGHERIGTGQMSRNYRISFDTPDRGPDAIVIKVPADDPSTRELGAHAYEREVTFYSIVAPRVPSGVAACHFHEIDGSDFTLILEDLHPATQGDQITGCSVDEAHLALANLAVLHATLWNDPQLSGHELLAGRDTESLGMIHALAHDQFMERYRDRLRPETVPVLEDFRDRAAAWGEKTDGPGSLVHGDYRLDNLLFTDDRVIAVDWQTATYGPPGRDVAYFLGNSLTIEDRRANERALLEFYCSELASHGVQWSVDELLPHYAVGGYQGVTVTVIGAFVATRTDRGDEMFIAMADRAAAQLIDHDSASMF